jgi:hypothetical protein
MECSHLDSLVDKKGKSDKNHYIHREVKCSHLVPKPDSRWLCDVVSGSKKKKSTAQL